MTKNPKKTISLHHSFDVEYAQEFGLQEAILIHHLQFWICQNQSTGKNFYDGRTWMYQTQKDISAIYPYLTEDAVQRTIKSLIDQQVIIKGNYNNTPFDRTCWYAFNFEEIFTKPQKCGIDSAKMRNADRESAESDSVNSRNPIYESAETYKDTDAKHMLKKQQQEPSVVVVFSCLKKKNLALSDDDQMTIMRHNFSEERLIAACEFVSHKDFHPKKSLIASIIWHCEQKTPPTHPTPQPTKDSSTKGLEIDPETIEERRYRFKQMRIDKWTDLRKKDLYCDSIGNELTIGNQKLSFLDIDFDSKYLKLLKYFNLE